MPATEIFFTNDPSHEELEIICKGLEKHAKKKIGKTSFEPFGFLVQDENGNLKGGCTGTLMYGFLHIKLLWVDEDLRNKGLGKELMQKAENFAKESNCRSIILETFDWQGEGFYERLGYEISFVHEGFDDDYKFYYYQKKL